MKCEINRPFKLCGCALFSVASVFVRRSIGRVCLLFSSRDCFLFIYSLFSLSFHFESMNSFDFFHCFAHLHVSSYNCVRIFVLIIRCFVRCCSLCSVTRAKTRRAHTYSLIVLVSIISSVRKNEVQSNWTANARFFSVSFVWVCAQRTAFGQLYPCSHHFSSFNYTVCSRKPMLIHRNSKHT